MSEQQQPPPADAPLRVRLWYWERPGVLLSRLLEPMHLYQGAHPARPGEREWLLQAWDPELRRGVVLAMRDLVRWEALT